MTEVKQLQCPACGANEVKQISGGDYRCDYCHSTFKVKEDDPFADFIKAAQGQSSQTHTSSSTFTTTINVTRPKQRNKKGALVAGVVISMVALGAALSVISITGKAKALAKGAWQGPTVSDYHCFAGSRGAVAWLLLKDQTSSLDSVKYSLRLVNPANAQVLATEPLGGARAWKDLFHWSDEFDNDYYVQRDTVYNVSDNGGIQGFDLYTGRRLFGSERFTSRFAELKEGIAKVDKEYYHDAIKISTSGGDDYLYSFTGGQLLGKEKGGHRHGQDAMVQVIYLSRGRKPQLYTATMERSMPDNYFLESYDIENWRSLGKRIKSLALISDTAYAKAQPLSAYKGGLLFFYVTDFTKDAGGVLQRTDAQGHTAWQNRDAAFKPLLDGNKDSELSLNYQMAGDLLVLNSHGSPGQSIGVDLKTGKTLFVYTAPEKVE